MLKVIYIFFLSCWVLWQNTCAQSLQFLGEKIEVTIQDEYAKVRGEYHFQNNSNQVIRRNLFYPFVINENLPYPDSILVVHLLDEMTIPFKLQNDGIFFLIKIPPESTAVYEVFYLQKTPAQKMEYILTTTKRWKAPLSFAEYLIKLPHLLPLKYLSLNPSESTIKGEYQIYRILKNDYMPTTNLIIEWERRTE